MEGSFGGEKKNSKNSFATESSLFYELLLVMINASMNKAADVIILNGVSSFITLIF